MCKSVRKWMCRDDGVILHTGGHGTTSQALRAAGEEASFTGCTSEDRAGTMLSRHPAHSRALTDVHSITATHAQTHSHTPLHRHEAPPPHLFDRVWGFCPLVAAGSRWASAGEGASWDWSGSPCVPAGAPASPGRRTPWCWVSWGRSWLRAPALSCHGGMASWRSLGRNSGPSLLQNGCRPASCFCFSADDRLAMQTGLKRGHQ